MKNDIIRRMEELMYSLSNSYNNDNKLSEDDFYRILQVLSEKIKNEMDKKMSPNEGGCWFCYKDKGEEMFFSHEFDAWFHEECLKKELKEHNPEAEIISDEYGNLFLDADNNIEAKNISEEFGESFLVRAKKSPGKSTFIPIEEIN